MKATYYRNLSVEKKRATRALLDKTKVSLKEQRRVLHDAFIKPLDDQIERIDRVLQNRIDTITIDEFIETELKRSKYLKKLLN